MTATVLRGAARKVRSLPNEMVRAGTKALREPVLDAYKRDSGGDLRLSGLTNSGRFRVMTSVRGDALARGRVFMGGPMAGPAKWLNDGTKPRRQGSGFHPGTRGKATFDRAVESNIDAAAKAMENLFDRSLR